MGIIRAAGTSISTSLADQWKEVLEPDNMGDHTLMTKGVKTGRRSQNKRGSKDLITDGSVIHVYDNQFMILTDGGKVIDYTAEPGYFIVKSGMQPSLFSGDFGEALSETFSRLSFGGEPSGKQKVFYLNLQEIKGLKFGTVSPVSYFDSFYNTELFLRIHGTYSIKISDPLKFYAEVIPRNAEQVEYKDVNDQFQSEFLQALQSSVNQMSADGIRVSFVQSKGRELGKYMSDTLDEEWDALRGVKIVSVGVSGISYTEESQKLIQMRGEGAMLSDPAVREGYLQGSVARGLEAAGSNANGSMSGFMGMGIGMQGAGAFMGTASNTNAMQMQQNHFAETQTVQSGSWTCVCGSTNTGNFCTNCGKPKVISWTCPKCGTVNTGNFCSNCGTPMMQQ